jgi:hypothetical protein
MVAIDLVVVDTESSWAAAYDGKRGNGTTESRKRGPVEHDLRATRLILALYLANKCGYGDIRSVTRAVIDYYGASGFTKEVLLTREELDVHFGVPVVDTVEAMTTELQRALHAEMRGLLTSALKNYRSGARRGHRGSALDGGFRQGRYPRTRDRPHVEISPHGTRAVAPADDLDVSFQEVVHPVLNEEAEVVEALANSRRTE